MTKIRLDISSTSIVITCSECPHWAGFQFDKGEAWKTAAKHESLCHPGERNAELALVMHLRRHAKAQS